ncbi:MAG TPA: hypothetical protein VMR18_03270 [Candidatus Saccharimonadales bacterium]|jgi:F0F1-type ATP synthase epsilon subunit|nr:hypothetical protein [Candidatus Saccharimonadales bacterium]
MSSRFKTAKKVSLSATNQSMMHVKVYSPYQIYFDEDAYSISALNNTGPFDILPGHHNFMTLLVPCEIIIRSQDKNIVQRIRISQGVMHVKADKTVVFLDV